MLNIKSTHNKTNLLLAILFAGALLVAPCSARKSIQSALDLEQTSVSNKSKAPLQSLSSCTETIQEETVYAGKTAVNETAPQTAGLQASTPELVPEKVAKLFTPFLGKTGRSYKIPLYILYQRLKYML